MPWQAVVLMSVAVFLSLVIGAIGIVLLVKEFKKQRAQAYPWGELPPDQPFLVGAVYPHDGLYYAILINIDGEGYPIDKPRLYSFSQLLLGGEQEVVTRENDENPRVEPLEDFKARKK